MKKRTEEEVSASANLKQVMNPYSNQNQIIENLSLAIGKEESSKLAASDSLLANWAAYGEKPDVLLYSKPTPFESEYVPFTKYWVKY